MVKQILIISFIFLSLNITSDEVPEKEKFSNQIPSITEGLSVDKKAKIYNINANKTGIYLKGSKIDNPTKNSIKIYKTPSKKDKYILRILDKDSNVISLIGLGDPFYIHLQHIGYEDSRVFGGYIQRDFDIPVSLDSKATQISLMEQNKFGLKEIRRIELN